MLKLIIGAVTLFYLNMACAYDTAYFTNNKELNSKVLTNSHFKMAAQWAYSVGGKESATQKATTLLSDTLLELKNRDTACDLGMVQLMDQTLQSNNNLLAVASYLRIENLIDDLFLDIIIKSVKLNTSLRNKERRGYPNLPPLNRYNDRTTDVDLASTYAEFSTWPDDISRCSLAAYQRLSRKLTWKNEKQRDATLRRLNYLAMEKDIISLSTFNKLEAFREEKALDWPVHLASYVDIANNAKDKLSSTGRPVMDQASFSTKHLGRKNKLTHRERLYKNFNSTQVMILSNIIEKTAKRLDARYVSINFQFNQDPDDIETYVLSPMEKYRLSLKMLRKDMAEVMRSETFSGLTIEYEDLVTAAYETGYIKADELELILNFEDFWDPKDPQWKTYANFAFSLAGTATWFLPPPWNIVGAIALVVTQTKVVKGNKPADADDNWNVVI